MATFIEIQTDAFAKNLERAAEALGYEGVRRPLRGIEIKEDTYAVIKVLKANGDPIPLTDAGGVKPPQSGSTTGAGSQVTPSYEQPGKSSMASTYNYSNFIIQRIEESRQEKSQILETFGDSYIFFFGERPRLLNVSGLLINTTDFNWRSEFWYNYENVLRGTRLVQENARLYLFWDDLLVEGYMLGATARDDAEMPYHIPFQFSLFVTNHTYLSVIGSDLYPVTHAVNVEPLLRDKDVLSAMEDLKRDQQETQQYISSVDIVRQAAEEAEFSRQLDAAANAGVTSTVQKFNAAKNLLLNALAVGLNAQNLTFLSVINHYFRNRKMRFPKGLAGGEAYTGEPQYANDPGIWEAWPQRTLPLRSKIRDNVDEYIAGGVQPANLDEDAILQAELDQQFKDPYLLESALMLDLAAMGLNPIQHPGVSPLKFANGLISIPTELPDVFLRAF